MTSLPANNFLMSKNQTGRNNLPNQNNYGARNQNRTDDLILTMDALYRLSYAGRILLLFSSKQKMERVMGIEPT
jgi:hypothetical protein